MHYMDEERQMIYRRLGRSGLRVSLLSFGSWVTFGPQLDVGLARNCLAAARDAGVNFFDNAESYAGGASEEIMGRALRELGWPRWSYVVSTKLFFGIHDAVNMQNTLNRKYLLQAVEGSLQRLGLDFVDLLFCHRPDPQTPIEETVWAMHDIVGSGNARYWGTSQWPAAAIRTAFEIAERHHLRKPVMEQPEYNLLQRSTVEAEYASLYDDYGLGLTTWSPLASGLLTGKYLSGVPADSRANLAGYEWLRPKLASESANASLRALAAIANQLGCTTSQLAIAWCARNPNVSSVITGASRLSQLEENLGALDVVDLLTDDVMAEIDKLFPR